MSLVFQAARECVIQCSNSKTPYRDIEAFCTALRHKPGWGPDQVDEVQRQSMLAILGMRRILKRDANIA